MSKVNLLISLLFFLPALTVAQTEATTTNSFNIGNQTIEYEETIAIDAGTLYYDKNTNEEGAIMVASSHDIDGDGMVDAWFVYDVNQNVILEAYDQTKDQTPDLVLTTDVNGEVTQMSGEMANALKRDLAIPFNPEPIANAGLDADLVGDVSDITIEQKDNNWIFFVILLIVGVGLYFFWKRQT